MPKRSLVPPSQRRRALGSGVALIAMAAFPPRLLAAPSRLEPTPSQTEGPFYPRTFPTDRDSNLTRIEGHAERARGTPLYLSGRVMRIDGAPMAGAQVELWQCDATGRYHHVGDPGPLDVHFQGFGVVTTDADGRYAFTTIRPVAYPGRPPHMHFKIRPAAGATLTTQLYIAGDRADGDAVLRSSPAGTYERLSVKLADASTREPGALAGSFDFVLR